MQITFQAEESLSLENSYGVIKQQESIQLEVTIGIEDFSGYEDDVQETTGWFEISDLETGGDEWYGSGGLWFVNKSLTDYDGVFALPTCVINKLKELGYDASYAE